MSDIYLGDLLNIDAPQIQEWKSDIELSQLILSTYQKISIKDSENWIKKNSSDAKQKLYGIFLKKDRKPRKLIGITRLMFIDNDAKTCELGMYIGDLSYRGKGFGKKALVLTLNIAFKKLYLNKVYLKVREDNLGAINLYENLGFEKEGKLKEHYATKKGYSNNNIILMALFNEK